MGFNRYAYALNNPLSLVDPSGFNVPGPDDREYGKEEENNSKPEEDLTDAPSDVPSGLRDFEEKQQKELTEAQAWDSFDRLVDQFRDSDSLGVLSQELQVAQSRSGGRLPYNQIPGGKIRGNTQGYIGPSGRVSGAKYVSKGWNKGTFNTPVNNFNHHYKEWVTKKGLNMSPLEYAVRARGLYRDRTAYREVRVNKNNGEPVTAVTGRDGFGLYDKHGKTITFHPKEP